MNAPATSGRREKGQALVVFALALVAIVAMTGLVIDGGGTFVQRRDMQNVADAAAMAGAYAYVNSSSASSAIAAAKANTAANGFTDGTNGVVVNVAVGSGSVTVTVSKPHTNYFSGIVGLPSWGVTTTASANTMAPNGATGAMPVIVNQNAVLKWMGQANEHAFNEPGTGTEDVPQGDSQFNWTVFCQANGNPCNGDSAVVDSLIQGLSARDFLVTLKMLIGPLNAGSHTTLFSDLAAYVGQEFPIAIVNDDGAMVGWAWFHLTGSVGGSTKQIRGYFESPVNEEALHVVQGGGNGTTAFGAYAVKLIN